MIPGIGRWGHQLRHAEKWKAWMTLTDILKQGTIELSEGTKGMTDRKVQSDTMTSVL